MESFVNNETLWKKCEFQPSKMETSRPIEAEREANLHRCGARLLHYKIHIGGRFIECVEKRSIVHPWTFLNHL